MPRWLFTNIGVIPRDGTIGIHLPDSLRIDRLLASICLNDALELGVRFHLEVDLQSGSKGVSRPKDIPGRTVQGELPGIRRLTSVWF